MLEKNPEKKFTAMDIVKIIYVVSLILILLIPITFPNYSRTFFFSQDVDENLYVAASVNVNQHLEKLRKEGKVTSSEALWQYRMPESNL